MPRIKNLLRCQWEPVARYSRFPMDQPRPPAFQKMYLSLVVCLKTGLSGAHSTKSVGEISYLPSQLA